MRMIIRRYAMRTKATVVAVLLVVVSAASVVYAAADQAKQQKLLEGAKKEGVIDILATWRPNESKPIFGAFKEAYPFIEVKQTMMSGATGFEQLRAEFDEERRVADHFNTSLAELQEDVILQAWQEWYSIFPDTKKSTVHPPL